MHGFAPIDIAEALAERAQEFTFTPGASSGNVKLSQPSAFQRPADSSSSLSPKPVAVEPIIYVWPSGAKDEISLDGGRGVGWRRSFVDMRIRGSQNDPVEARILGDRIMEVLDHKPPDGYCECFTISGPADIGRAQDGFPEVAIPGWELFRDLRPRPQGWGSGAPGSGASQPFLESLANAVVEDLRFRTFTLTVAAGQSGYLYFPADRGPATILTRLPTTPGETTPAFADGLWSLVTDALPFTTDLGADVYSVYETNGTGLGAITVRVR